MTTFDYTITIDESEHAGLEPALKFMAGLEAALKFMIELCELQINKGEGEPYWAHRLICNQMLAKLNNLKLSTMSTSSVFHSKA